MGAELRIESLYDRAWAAHGETHRQAVADRDHFAAETRDRLGPKVAAEVQLHVDVALGRLLADHLPDLSPAAERAFHQLWALEMAIIEVEARVEAGRTFFDPYVVGLLPMPGRQNVVPLIDGTGQSYMRSAEADFESERPPIRFSRQLAAVSLADVLGLVPAERHPGLIA